MNNLVCIIPVSDLRNAKSRLSSFLSNSEREELLKKMLLDIVSNVSKQVDSILLVSKDEKIRDFCEKNSLIFVREAEHRDNFLNNAIVDAINVVRSDFPENDILILPSDIPLITGEIINDVKSKSSDLVISPSCGGGTNLLCFRNNFDFKPLFGDRSFFNHLKEAEYLKMNVNILDSFFLSLDVNIPNDLGEILLHGRNTCTYAYLSSIGVCVEVCHGVERLYVRRV